MPCTFERYSFHAVMWRCEMTIGLRLPVPAGNRIPRMRSAHIMTPCSSSPRRHRDKFIFILNPAFSLFWIGYNIRVPVLYALTTSCTNSVSIIPGYLVLRYKDETPTEASTGSLPGTEVALLCSSFTIPERNFFSVLWSPNLLSNIISIWSLVQYRFEQEES